MTSLGSDTATDDISGCGYLNGRELLGYYTMAQTSFTLFITVIVAMAICMAWSVAEDELQDRRSAEEWLKKECIMAFEMREQFMTKFGRPASSIRPEGSVVWVVFGVVAALSFTLLGWHNWSVIPPSHTSTLLIILNILTILTSTLILHLGFFGRVSALYKRNEMRVVFLSELLLKIDESCIDAWWNCRNFVLNDDLALDYDLGGLAVSLTFAINLTVVFVLLIQTTRDGFRAILEPPGSYCAYACLYITMCLLKIFNFAMHTFEEQMLHMSILQRLSIKFTPSMSTGNSFSNIQHLEGLERVFNAALLAETEGSVHDVGLDLDQSMHSSSSSCYMDPGH